MRNKKISVGWSRVGRAADNRGLSPVPRVFKFAFVMTFACCVAQVHAQTESKYVFRGEYRLARDPFHAPICNDITNNLNQFRNLDFDTCHPRQSEKYMKFTRPVWNEIPFDLAIAEDVIKSAGSYGLSQIDHSSPVAMAKVAEDYWRRWKVLAEPFLQAGQARMWRLTNDIDIDRDGHGETLIRLMPGDEDLGVYVTRMKPSPRLTKWNCDYNRGAIYVLQANNPHTKGNFNSKHSRGTDLIQYADDGQYYLLHYLDHAGSGHGQSLPRLGATRAVLVKDFLVFPNTYDAGSPVGRCWIQWFPTESNPTAGDAGKPQQARVR
jgi:hypothetical protein